MHREDKEMQNKFIRFNIVFLLLLLVLPLSACSSNKSPSTIDKPKPEDEKDKTQESMFVSDLQIGDRIIDPTWDWEYRQGYGYMVYSANEVTKPVSWIVVAKDHYGAGEVTLISEFLIGFYIFDNSTLESGLLAGQGHWGNSGLNQGQGLRTWLNSTDQQEDEGFYHAFSSDFKSIIIPTTLENVVWDTGETYITQDNVFIPSLTEFGADEDEINDSFVLGEAYPYFKDADYSKLSVNLKGGFSYGYWARNTFKRGYRLVGMVDSSGIYVDWFADADNLGVRPAITIKATTKVSDKPNEEGYYEIIYK